MELWLKQKKLEDLTEVDLHELKRRGFSDSQIARAVGECSGGGSVGMEGRGVGGVVDSLTRQLDTEWASHLVGARAARIVRNWSAPYTLHVE